MIELTPELVALFKSNWSLLVTATNFSCKISYPFFYMKSDKFWKLVPREGYDNMKRLDSLVSSFNRLHEAIEYAVLDDDLYQLMMDPANNMLLQQFLLDEYFPQTKLNYKSSEEAEQQLMLSLENKILKERSSEYSKEIKVLLENKDEEEVFLRGSMFKKEIPKIYFNTCAISGMRIDSMLNISMVDACHIVPFSKSYDDTITNGIALCPNLHRAFDRGLISINDEYKVIVSNTFKEADSNYALKIYEGKQILLPTQKSYFPQQQNLDWHRENVFKVLN